MQDLNATMTTGELAEQAGQMHGAIMEKIAPWLRSDSATREKLAHEALEKSVYLKILSAQESEAIKNLIDSINKENDIFQENHF